MNRIERFLPWIIISMVTIVYILTGAKTVQEIDAGELAAVQFNAGVAHPTGYPLFTLIGFMWSKLPLGLTPIHQLNLLSAICMAISLWFFYQISKALTALPFKQESQIQLKKGKIATAIQQLTLHYPYLIPITTVLTLAFSKTFWEQSTGVEVHALQMLLWSFFLYTSIKLTLAQNWEQKQVNIWLLALGLLFTNHLSAISALVMALLVSLFANRRYSISEKLKMGLKALPFFFIPIILGYGFLIWRAQSDALPNWGGISDLDSFWRHVTGKQYQVWLFSDNKAFAANIKAFITSLPKQYTIFALILIGVGVLDFFKTHRALWYIMTGTIVFNVWYVSNYAIKDLEPYYLISITWLSLNMVFGLRYVFTQLPWLIKRKYLQFTVLALPLFIAESNYKLVDRSHQKHVHQYTEFVLASLPPNAMVITKQWDVFAAPALYFQHVQKLRPDVLIIEKELLRRSWYVQQILQHDEKLKMACATQANEYLNVLYDFEANRPYDANQIQQRFESMITQFVQYGIANRTVCLMPEIVANEIVNGQDVILPDSAFIIPQTAWYSLHTKMEYLPLSASTDIPFEIPNQSDLYTKYVRSGLIIPLTDRINYELTFKQTNQAQALFNQLRILEPNVPPPPGITAPSANQFK